MDVEMLIRAVMECSKNIRRVLGPGYLESVYKADIVVEGILILELKAVQSLHMAHEIQLVNYLTATGIDHGLLINFGSEELQFKRKYRVYRKQFA